MKRVLIIMLIVFHIPALCQQWKSLVEGSGLRPTVSSLHVHKNILIIGGAFIKAGNLDVNSLVGFDSIQWISIDFPLHYYLLDHIKSITSYNESIFVGGKWKDSIFERTLATFQNNVWSSFEQCPNNTVLALSNKNNLYLGGGFQYIEGYTGWFNNIAAWDGTEYKKLNGGVTGAFPEVNAMTVYNDELIVGGNFERAGGKDNIYCIARWNEEEEEWSDLDTGLWGTVYALTVDSINNFLYAGGIFTYAGGQGGIPVQSVARWNGESWEKVGKGIMADIYCLKMYHKELYVGFPGVGCTVAKFDGDTFVCVNGYFNSSVFTLEVYKDELYAGGGFTTINGDSIFGIARYWAPPPTHCNWLMARIFADKYVVQPDSVIHFKNNNKYAQSWEWDFGDGHTASGIQKPMHAYSDTGTYNVRVIVAMDGCVDTAFRLIKVVGTTGVEEKDGSKQEAVGSRQEVVWLGQNVPNPHSGTTVIDYRVPEDSKAFLLITDAQGEMVDEYKLDPRARKVEVSLKGMAEGTYFYSLVVDGKKVETRRMVFLK